MVQSKIHSVALSRNFEKISEFLYTAKSSVLRILKDCLYEVEK